MSLNLTTRDMRELYRRRQAGERVVDLAAEVGCTIANLYRRWRRLKLYSSKLIEQERQENRIGYKGWSMRKQGKTYFDIAEAVGWERNAKSARRARAQIARYCERVGLTLPNVEPRGKRS